MKVQAAFEYMIIIAIVIAFITPLWAYNLGVQRQTNTELSFAYAKNLVNKIADTANLVNSQGPPAKLTLTVFIPEGVIDVNISSNRINLQVRIDSGYSDVFQFSQATLNGTLPTNKGTYSISIEAREGFVQITPQI